MLVFGTQGTLSTLNLASCLLLDACLCIHLRLCPTAAIRIPGLCHVPTLLALHACQHCLQIPNHPQHAAALHLLASGTYLLLLQALGLVGASLLQSLLVQAHAGHLLPPQTQGPAAGHAQALRLGLRGWPEGAAAQSVLLLLQLQPGIPAGRQGLSGHSMVQNAMAWRVRGGETCFALDGMLCGFGAEKEAEGPVGCCWP